MYYSSYIIAINHSLLHKERESMTLRRPDNCQRGAPLHSCHYTTLNSFFWFGFFMCFLSDIQLDPQSRRETQFVKVAIVMATPSSSSPPLSQTWYSAWREQEGKRDGEEGAVRNKAPTNLFKRLQQHVNAGWVTGGSHSFIMKARKCDNFAFFFVCLLVSLILFPKPSSVIVNLFVYTLSRAADPSIISSLYSQ